jgi:hypothetical protein
MSEIPRRILTGCAVTAVLAIGSSAAAPSDAGGPEGVMSTQSATQKPTGTGGADPEGAKADERAKATEAKMTDDERFSLIISVFGCR